MASSSVRFIIHVLLCLSFIYGAILDLNVIPPKFFPIPYNRLSKLVWLTMIDLYAQIGYHAFAAFISVVGVRRNIMKKFHIYSSTLFFPVACSVTFLFWSLYCYDKSLLAPKHLIEYVNRNAVHNHLVHSLPLVAMVVDRYIWNHGKTKKSTALKHISILAIFYIIDIHIVQSISGFWAYGVLAALPLIYRWLFFLLCGGVLFVAFLTGDFLNKLFHGVRKAI